MLPELSACNNCQAEETDLRRRIVGNGVAHFVYQCLRCGRARSSAIRHSLIPNPTGVAPWDSKIEKDYDEQRRQAGTDRMAEIEQQRITDRENWLAEHDAYLQTPHWRTKRAAVLQRDKYICHGCLVATATQVHHLSYKHWKEEFLFELVSICDACHERFHEKTE